MINNHCNLNCEYCFANKILEKDKQNMSLSDFIKVVEFNEQSKSHRIAIIGGEPTIHPQFLDFLEILKGREKTQSVYFFSNGLFSQGILNAFIQLSSVKRISFLINYNHPSVIREKRNKLILSNIDKLLESQIELTFGINIYKHKQDYAYIIAAIKKYKLKSIRWAIVVPNDIKKANIDVKAYFNEYKKEVLNFLKTCYSNDIIPFVDCNNLPLCIYDDEEFRELVFLGHNSISACCPVIDVLTDLSVIRCFALSEYKKAKLSDFKTIDDIRKYFEETIDKDISSIPLFEECKECVSFKMKKKSCACMAYKIKK